MEAVPKALIAAAALLAACGSTVDRKVFESFRDICNGLVQGRVTLQGTAQTFGLGAYGVECALAPQEPIQGGVDQCDYLTAHVCQVFWVGYARDQSVCGPAGCFYWCEVRAPGTGLTQPPQPDATVCATRFVSGQPCPPYGC